MTDDFARQYFEMKALLGLAGLCGVFLGAPIFGVVQAVRARRARLKLLQEAAAYVPPPYQNLQKWRSQ